MVLFLMAVALLGAGMLVMFVRALGFTSRQERVAPAVVPAVDAEAAAARLARALAFPTISHENAPRTVVGAFAALRDYLQEAFPRVHGALRREVVSGGSLLYTWPGRTPAHAAVLFVSHLDVVPVEAGTEADWTYPPFGGVVAGGCVWGRGALDVKAGLMGILEAVEHLLAEGFRPRQTVYLAFGHDEERHGVEGAARIAALLAARGVRLACVFDEGGFTLRDALPGLSGPVAYVGIAEKGFLTLELTATAEGGHAATPPPHTAVGLLSRAVCRLEARPFPARLDGAGRLLLAHAGPEMSFALRLVFANLWLFGPLVRRALVRHPRTAALVRTTTAATVFEGGVKANVLPARARALVNLRLLPGDRPKQVTEAIRQQIGDARVQVRIVPPAIAPSPVSDPEAGGYRALARALRQVGAAEGVRVVPYLLPAGTDSRHYAPLADDVYRFASGIHPEDLSGIHGTDERISVAGYASLICVYAQLLRNLEEL